MEVVSTGLTVALVVASLHIAVILGSAGGKPFHFKYKDSTYLLVPDKGQTQESARAACAEEYDARLASIQSVDELRAVQSFLSRYRFIQRGVWANGKTDRISGSMLTVMDRPGSTGDMCVLLHFGHVTMTVNASCATVSAVPLLNMHSYPCNMRGPLALCETTRVPHYKFMAARGPGLCDEGAKLARGVITASGSSCSALGGAYHGTNTEPTTLVNCYFDFCASNESVPSGLVPAVKDTCHRGDVLGAVKAYGGQCRSFGGEPQPEVGDWHWTNCFLDWCRPYAQVGHMYGITGRDQCPIKDRVGVVLVYMLASDCWRLGGGSFGSPQDWSQMTCKVTLCRLQSNIGCKTTEIGKEYNGSLANSVSGRMCQRWDSQTPHPHSNTVPDWFPEKDVRAAGNRCRNPAGWIEGPFCYTTDDDVPWEQCDVPFCPGYGPETVDFFVDITRYIYVPGLYNQLASYCTKKFGGTLAQIRDARTLDKINEGLASLRNKGHELSEKIWVGGSTTHSGRISPKLIETLIFDEPEVGNSGLCIMLSSRNDSAPKYSHSGFQLLSESCPLYRRNFLCQVVEDKLEGVYIDGGSEQIGYSDEYECTRACLGDCLAVDYDRMTKRCWFHTRRSACLPGLAKANMVHYAKVKCVCNQKLVSGSGGVKDAAITATSLRPNGTMLSAAWRARLEASEEVDVMGVWRAGWSPATNDLHQHITVEFDKRREVYGVMTRGGGVPVGQWVKSYKLQLSEDCNTYSFYSDKTGVKVFHANTDADGYVYNPLSQVRYVRCVRIWPSSWHRHIALRFDVIGCMGYKENLALGKTSMQSSTAPSGESSLAVDGFMVSDFRLGSCSSTRRQAEPWWSVDLGHIYHVKVVRVTNRLDCCGEELDNLIIDVGFESAPRAATVGHVTCAKLTGSIEFGATETIECGEGVTGRFVVLRLAGVDRMLTLCEVQIYGNLANLTNVALGKRAYQKSDHLGALAGRAVDGNPGPDLHGGGCASTGMATDPWWMVDLEYQYDITNVMITNRGDCCGSRLRDVIITVSQTYMEQFITTDSPSTSVCAVIHGSFTTGQTRHVTCTRPIQGRFVMVMVRGQGQYLTLCEVQIYAERVATLTFGGTSERAACVFPFHHGGRTFTACTDTGRDLPWCITEGTTSAREPTWGYCLDVRVRGGRDEREGRVEVLTRGVWGTVCDDDWDDIDASVVCRQLGYHSGVAVYSPVFPPGVGDIAMNKVDCNGRELSLAQCAHTASRDCSHREDAGVRCMSYSEVDMWVGYPAFERQDRDDWSHRVILVARAQQAGVITSWTLFLIKPSTVELQVWRPDPQQPSFSLVGSNTIISRSAGRIDVAVSIQNRIRVYPGDAIGILFEEENPVPFDYNLYCSDSRIMYSLDLRPSGMTLMFYSKEDSHEMCRLYSVFARISASGGIGRDQFALLDSVYALLPLAVSRDVACHVCTSLLGENATLLQIESEREYDVITKELHSRQANKTVWMLAYLGPRAVEPDVITDKSHCLTDAFPCWTLSPRLDAAGFLSSVVPCRGQHDVICERNNSKSMGVKVQANHSGSASTAWILKVVGGIFTALVAMAAIAAGITLCHRRQKRLAMKRRLQHQMGVSVAYSGDCALFLPSTDSMSNPMYESKLFSYPDTDSTNSGSE